MQILRAFGLVLLSFYAIGSADVTPNPMIKAKGTLRKTMTTRAATISRIG